MAKKLYTESSIQDIANAIREKNGLTDLYKVSEMGDAIRDIYIPEPVEDGNEILYGPETQADDKNKQYYEPDIKDISDAIREKRDGVGSYKVSEMSTAIRNIEQGAALNVEYGLTPPSDTSKLWVKCDKPTNVTVSPRTTGNEVIDGLNITSDLPLYGYDRAVVAVGTKIYMFGGNLGSTSSSLSHSNEIACYDTVTNTYTKLNVTLPEGYKGMGAGLVGTNIYLFGGFAASRSNWGTNTIFKFDTINHTLTKLDVTLPKSMGYMGVAVIGTKIYLLGGSEDRSYYTSNNSINIFDTETETITQWSATLPSKQEEMAVGVVGTKIYLVGGLNGKYAVKHIQIVDVESMTAISSTTSLPSTFSKMGYMTVGAKMYLFGGDYNGTLVNTIMVFDTTDLSLTTLDTILPSTFNNIDVCTVGSKTYLIGGHSNGASNVLMQFILNRPLPTGDVYIQTDMTSNFFPLISGETAIETGIRQVYVGNSDNIMEAAEAYIHNGTDWVLI